jgi:hypothetical protein
MSRKETKQRDGELSSWCSLLLRAVSSYYLIIFLYNTFFSSTIVKYDGPLGRPGPQMQIITLSYDSSIGLQMCLITIKKSNTVYKYR